MWGDSILKNAWQAWKFKQALADLEKQYQQRMLYEEPSRNGMARLLERGPVRALQDDVVQPKPGEEK